MYSKQLTKEWISECLHFPLRENTCKAGFMLWFVLARNGSIQQSAGQRCDHTFVICKEMVPKITEISQSCCTERVVYTCCEVALSSRYSV